MHAKGERLNQVFLGVGYRDVTRASTGLLTGPGIGPVRGLKKNSGLRVLTGLGLQWP